MPIRDGHSQNYGRPSAARQFTDREEFVSSFRSALLDSRTDERRVLVYYGVGGIGKTSLRNELVRLLDDDRASPVRAVLDFEVPGFREQETALFVLRRALRDRYRVSFPTFDIAYALFWRKTRPQIPLTQETFPLLEGDGPIPDMIRIIGSLSGMPLVSLAPTFSKLVFKGQKSIRAWWARRGRSDLDALPRLEPREIAERLPAFWAADLNDYLAAKRMPAVIFVDSYESLWEDARSEARAFKQDEWVRDLVGRLPGVLWVICGREKLRWEEYDADWAGRLEQHLVGDLSEADARHFLQSCGIWDVAVQKAIVEGSRGLPYYLDLAVDTYFDITARRRRDPVPADFAQTTREVLTRFLRNLDRSEIETLKVLSVARLWDQAVFAKLVTGFGTGYPATALPELARFSFIHQGEAPGTWSMHQLMRDSLGQTMDPDLLRSVHRLLFDHHAQTLVGLEVKAITDRHKVALGEAYHHGRAALAAGDLFDWYRDRAQVFEQAALWRFLLPMSADVSVLLEQTLGPEDPRVATALRDLATFNTELGRYGEAEPLLRRALDLTRQALGAKHPEVAATLKDLAALVFISQGRFPETEALLREALAIAEPALGPEHPDVVQMVRLLADTCREQGRFPEAEALYGRVMSVWEKTLDPGDLKMADALNSLAVLLWMQARYAEVEPYFRRALEIREKALGPVHPDVAELVNNLAVLYRRQGRYAEAEPLYQRALSVREETMGPDHPVVAQSANNLGLFYCNRGEYAKAEERFKQAIEILQRAFGPEHPDLANFLNSLGGLYWITRRYDEAEALFRRALAMMEKFLGPEHPGVAEAMANLAGLYNDWGRNDEADPLVTRAVEIMEKTWGPDHPGLGRALNTLANTRRCQGRFEEAEPIYQRSLTILKTRLGPDHVDVARVLQGIEKLQKRVK